MAAILGTGCGTTLPVIQCISICTGLKQRDCNSEMSAFSRKMQRGGRVPVPRIYIGSGHEEDCHLERNWPTLSRTGYLKHHGRII